MDRNTEERLIGLAQQRLCHAYAPYSGIRVAAAVQTADGAVFCGVNVENASYGLTVCAERNAVAAAVEAGHTAFAAMAVVSDAPAVRSPCGACRQVLREFSGAMELVFLSPAGRYRYTVEELLPCAFALEEDGP